MARTILNESLIPKTFWANAKNTTCYVMNRALIKLILNKTLYDLYFGRKSNISHFHIFGSKYYVHNNGKDNLDKFDSKSDETLFIRYSSSSKASHVFNKRILKIEESMHFFYFFEFHLSDCRLRE